MEGRDAADRDRPQGVAVIRVLECDELGAFGLAAQLPVLERHLERDLDRGRAVVAVEDARQSRRRDRDELLGQLDRGLVG
jgi:hypothetical protein